MPRPPVRGRAEHAEERCRRRSQATANGRKVRASAASVTSCSWLARPSSAKASSASRSPAMRMRAMVISGTQELAGDDFELEDRLHALEDGEDERVDDVAGDGVFLGVSPAAVDELRFLAHPDGDVGGKQLAHRRRQGARSGPGPEGRRSALLLVALHGPRGRVSEMAAGRHVCRHASDLVLGELVIGEGLARTACGRRRSCRPSRWRPGRRRWRGRRSGGARPRSRPSAGRSRCPGHRRRPTRFSSGTK